MDSDDESNRNGAPSLATRTRRGTATTTTSADPALPREATTMIAAAARNAAVEKKPTMEHGHRYRRALKQAWSASDEACRAHVVARTLDDIAAWTPEDRERHVRLINLDRWPLPPSDEDVLLPRALVTSASHSRGGATLTPSVDREEVADTSSQIQRAASSSSLVTTNANATLKFHQVEGIRFLWQRTNAPQLRSAVSTRGCILAHSMGLGKTCQVICYLHLLFLHHGHDDSATAATAADTFRVLILAPKSTLSGWQDEYQRWTPYFFPDDASLALPLTVLDGESFTRAQRLQRLNTWKRGIIVMGFESFAQTLSHKATPSGGGGGGANTIDGSIAPAAVSSSSSAAAMMIPTPEMIKLDLLVVDEAHRLKSDFGQVHQVVSRLDAARRVLLTGTPLQNHLTEYWSMIELAVPGFFSKERFKRFFIQPIAQSMRRDATKEQNDAAKKRTFVLHKTIEPFVQRRDGSTLHHELPPLHEFVVSVPLSPLQMKLYQGLVEAIKMSREQNLLRLYSLASKICAHPQLFYDLRERLMSGGRHSEENDEAEDGATGSATRKPLLGREATATTSSGGATRESQQHHRVRRGDTNKSIDVDDLDLSDLDVPSSSRYPDDEDDEADSPAVQRRRRATSKATEPVPPQLVPDRGVKRGRPGAAGRAPDSNSGSASAKGETLRDALIRLTTAPPSYDPQPNDSAKLILAVDIVQRCLNHGEKVLIFSLSTMLLDWFEVMLTHAALSRKDERLGRFFRIDGSVSHKDRADRIHSFQKQHNNHLQKKKKPQQQQRAAASVVREPTPSPVLSQEPDAGGASIFLLSTRATAIGVTLTAASRILILDSSWNPVDDRQAIGRAYRYGQTRPVFVYRLVCYGTLEHRIFDQKLGKEWLFQTVVDSHLVKRDALRGTSLQNALVVDRPPPIPLPPLQEAKTQSNITHDAWVLAQTPRNRFIEIIAHDSILQADRDDEYGNAEMRYYEEFLKRGGMDALGDDAAGGGGGIAAPVTSADDIRQEAALLDREGQYLAARVQAYDDLYARALRARGTNMMGGGGGNGGGLQHAIHLIGNKLSSPAATVLAAPSSAPSSFARGGLLSANRNLADAARGSTSRSALTVDDDDGDDAVVVTTTVAPAGRTSIRTGLGTSSSVSSLPAAARSMSTLSSIQKVSLLTVRGNMENPVVIDDEDEEV